jgi:hypothetical protein
MPPPTESEKAQSRDWDRVEIPDARERPEAADADEVARCFCGVEITNRSMNAHIRAFHRRIGE